MERIVSRTTQAFLSAAVGVIYAPVWLLLWSQFIRATPHLSWLVDLGLSGNAIRVASNIIDFVVNVVLALAPATALVRFNHNRKFGTLLALIAWIVALAVLTRNGFVQNMLKTPSMLMLIAAIPVAVCIVARIIDRRPNNSFKPTPLRGAA